MSSNEELEKFKQYIKGKNVAVLGIGISNTPLIKFLVKLGAKVTAFDKKEKGQIAKAFSELEPLGVDFSLGEGYLQKLKGFDIVFKTPGMRFDVPEIVRAQEGGAMITSEMETFMKLCPAQIIGVTGSDGKTTTTTLIHKMLECEGYKCWLGGNIGNPLLNRIEEIQPEDKVVLELSSFQLHTMKNSPDIAIITNIAPNHLDVHKSMEEYIEAKKNVFKFQGEKSRLILNYDNETTRKLADEAKGKVTYFSRKADISGVMVENGEIVLKIDGASTLVINTDEILIPGVHNVENYLAAIAAVYDSVSIESIRKVARTFAGVEHRIELVREINGVKFYNDSIASSPTRTIAGVNSFGQKVILIAGGYDKKIPYDSMGDLIINKVKKLILAGQTSGKIKEAYLNECKESGKEQEVPVFETDSLEEAIKISYNESTNGDIVILSPASASFDMFRNFEERGNRFKEIVNSL